MHNEPLLPPGRCGIMTPANIPKPSQNGRMVTALARCDGGQERRGMPVPQMLNCSGLSAQTRSPVRGLEEW